MFILNIYDGDRFVKKTPAEEVVVRVENKGLLNPGDTLMVEGQERKILSMSGTTDGQDTNYVVQLEELKKK